MEVVKLKELSYTVITHQAIPSNNGKNGELERSAKLAITDHYAPVSLFCWALSFFSITVSSGARKGHCVNERSTRFLANLIIENNLIFLI